MHTFRHAPSLPPQAQLVNGLLRPCGITDTSVLSAFLKVDKKLYTQPHDAPLAYTDAPLALGTGRGILAPQVHGLLLQGMTIQPSDKILVVGCATGYTCALLNAMGVVTVGVESDDALVKKATSLNDEHGCKLSKFVRSSLTDGFIEWAPYAGIIFDGAIHRVPNFCLAQLKENGRVAAVFQAPESGTDKIQGSICIFTKKGATFEKVSLGCATQPYLQEFQPTAAFRF